MSPPLPRAVIFNILKAGQTRTRWLWNFNPSRETTACHLMASTLTQKNTYMLNIFTHAYAGSDEKPLKWAKWCNISWGTAYILFNIHFLFFHTSLAATAVKYLRKSALCNFFRKNLTWMTQIKVMHLGCKKNKMKKINKNYQKPEISSVHRGWCAY